METEHVTKAEIKERKRQAKTEQQIKVERSRMMKKIGWWIGGAIIIGGPIGWFAWKVATSPVLSSDDLRRQELAGCVQHNGIGTHIHPVLTIRLKGERVEIPENTGIDSDCMHPIHTHDNSGTLHLEFPKPRDVRLKEFFEIWGKRFDSQCIFEHCNGSEGTVKMTVNGQPNTEFGEYVMHDHDQIEIMYE